MQTSERSHKTWLISYLTSAATFSRHQHFSPDRCTQTRCPASAELPRASSCLWCRQDSQNWASPEPAAGHAVVPARSPSLLEQGPKSSFSLLTCVCCNTTAGGSLARSPSNHPQAHLFLEVKCSLVTSTPWNMGTGSSNTCFNPPSKDLNFSLKLRDLKYHIRLFCSMEAYT